VLEQFLEVGHVMPVELSLARDITPATAALVVVDELSSSYQGIELREQRRMVCAGTSVQYDHRRSLTLVADK
jgi:hypothetical protein